MNSKVTITVIVLVLLGAGIWYMQSTSVVVPIPATVPVTEQPANNPSDIVAKVPVPTGKVDDILASLGGEQSQEATGVQTENADMDAAVSDNTVISDLSQSYDETTL